MADSDEEILAHLKNLNKSAPAVCSLVAIGDYSVDKSIGDSTVFPPVNHENIYISTNSIQKIHSQSYSPPFPSSPSLSSSLSSSSFSPDNDDSSYSFAASDSNIVDPPKSVPDSPRAPARTACYRVKWWNLGLQVLFHRCLIPARRALITIFSPFGLLAMFMMFAYIRRRRRLIRGHTKDQLRRTITEKDERINQLLGQIAEMNQVLLALHKGNLSNN